jgi:hypothetical protein
LTSPHSTANLKLQKYITRSGKISKKLISGSHGTIHHHYAKTPLPKFNKKNFLSPHLVAEARTSTKEPPSRGEAPTPHRIPFFFTPHPYPYLSFLYPQLKLFLYSRLFLATARTLRKCDCCIAVLVGRKEKNLLIKMSRWDTVPLDVLWGNVSYAKGSLCISVWD